MKGCLRMKKHNDGKPLSPDIALETFREYRQFGELTRGEVKKDKLKPRDKSLGSIAFFGVFLLGGGVVALFWLSFFHPLESFFHDVIPAYLTIGTPRGEAIHYEQLRFGLSLAMGYEIAFIAAMLLMLFPLLKTFIVLPLRGQKLTKTTLQEYSTFHKICMYFVLSFLVTCCIHPGNAAMLLYLFFTTPHPHESPHFSTSKNSGQNVEPLSK